MHVDRTDETNMGKHSLRSFEKNHALLVVWLTCPPSVTRAARLECTLSMDWVRRSMRYLYMSILFGMGEAMGHFNFR